MRHEPRAERLWPGAQAEGELQPGACPLLQPSLPCSMKHECMAPALTHLCEPRARQVEVHVYVLADVLTEEQERACEGRMSEDQIYTLFGIHMVAAPYGEQ